MISMFIKDSVLTTHQAMSEPFDEIGISLKIHGWCEEWWASNDVSDTLHTTFNQCANTRGIETQVKKKSFTETSIEVWILQKQLW